MPECLKCRNPAPPELCNRGEFVPCPVCDAPLWVETFPALTRPVARGAAGQPALVAGESACFYHENKKAEVVCDTCGRFLCGLCDVDLQGQHLCPACVEAGRRQKSIHHLEDWRPLHGRMALVLSILPFLLTGLIAIYLALRHWKTPGSLVRPARWQMPVALALGILQVGALTTLIVLAANS